MEPESMYRWRRMTDEQRRACLDDRRRYQLPWHSLPHYESPEGLYLITAACYEHRPIVGHSTQRMTDFEAELVRIASSQSELLLAWNLLPNHYHFLTRTRTLKGLLRRLGALHGRTSFQWNGEEGCRGRHVWCGAAETVMKSERHFWATLNYVLHNAVRHGYVTRWQEWPYSNAAEYLETTGRVEVERRWREYPIDDYGRDWDPPEL